MPTAWHPKRLFAYQKKKKKKLYQFLISNAFNISNLRVLEYFDT